MRTSITSKRVKHHQLFSKCSSQRSLSNITNFYSFSRLVDTDLPKLITFFNDFHTSRILIPHYPPEKLIDDIFSWIIERILRTAIDTKVSKCWGEWRVNNAGVPMLRYVYQEWNSNSELTTLLLYIIRLNQSLHQPSSASAKHSPHSATTVMKRGRTT